MLLDIGDWFAMTGQQRRDYLLGSLAVDTSEIDSGILSRVKAIEIDPPYKEHDTEKDEIVSLLDFWMGERDEHNQPVGEWFSHQVTLLKERVSEKKLVDEQQTALLQTIAQERASGSGGIPADQTAALLKHGHDRDVLLQRIGEASNYERSVSGRRTLETLLAEIPADVTEKCKEWSDKLSELTAKKEKLQASSGRTEKYRHLINDVESAIARIDGRHSALVEQGDELTRKYDEAKSAKCCPTCGREGLGKRQKEIDQDYQTAKGKIGGETMSLIREKLEAEEKLDELRKQFATVEKAEAEVDDLVNRIRDVSEQFRTYAEQSARRERYQKQLAALPELPAQQPDATKLQAELTAVDALITESQALQKRRLLLLERNAQEAEALERRDAARRTIEVAKAALEIVVDVQSKTVVDAFGPFVSKVRRFTDGLLSFELSHRDGDLGYVGPRGQWVSHTTFSGAEKAVTYAGLGVALADKCPVRVVLIDEVLISDANKQRVGDRFIELIKEGVLDQCFVCDTSATGWPAGANIIEV